MEKTSESRDLNTLPRNLPVPKDDGACQHLVGMRIPHGILLHSTRNRIADAREISSNPEGGRVVLFFYPRTGKPGAQSPKDWDLIPGARGCTPESCSYRDLYSEFRHIGCEVYGVSTQSAEDQLEFSQRSKIPYEILSDFSLQLTRALKLPTFTVEEVPTPLIKRLTIVFDSQGTIEKVFYPVFPPDKNATEVLRYLQSSS